MKLSQEQENEVRQDEYLDYQRVLIRTKNSIAYFESDQYKAIIKDRSVYGKQQIEADQISKQELERQVKKLESRLEFIESKMIDNLGQTNKTVN